MMSLREAVAVAAVSTASSVFVGVVLAALVLATAG